MASENLRDLVERGAAKHGRSAREVWCWAFDAILGDELAAELPRHHRFNTPEIERKHWLNLLASTRDATARGTDPSMCGWTPQVTLDPQQFEEWLSRRSSEGGTPRGPRGPRSRRPEMLAAYQALKANGVDFMSWTPDLGPLAKV
jgi:hypothetical protein